MIKVRRLNLPNCILLSNGNAEVVVTTNVGPRVIGYSFVGSINILGEHLDARVEIALGEFKQYGGHRLWIAPENMPNSYAPDNAPIEFYFDESKNSIRLVQPVEPVTKTQKEIVVTLDETGSGVSVNHKVTNCGTETIELSAWA